MARKWTMDRVDLFPNPFCRWIFRIQGSLVRLALLDLIGHDFCHWNKSVIKIIVMPCGESVLLPQSCQQSSNFADDDPFIPRPFRRR